MFGFSVYNSGNDQGEIAFPAEEDILLGGHAVIAMGYDDEREIGGGARKVGGKIKQVPPDKGALKIRNSWGPDWGEDGYGWLPYRYVLEGLTADFWSLLKATTSKRRISSDASRGGRRTARGHIGRATAPVAPAPRGTPASR